MARANLCDAFEASDLPFRVDIVEAHALAAGMRVRVFRSVCCWLNTQATGFIYCIDIIICLLK